MTAEAVKVPSVVKLIREWLSVCDTQHDCASSSASPKATDRSPTWVIDAQKNCIVSGALAGRYLALSYVWPEKIDRVHNTGAQPVRLERARLLHFQTPGSLQDPSHPLPKVIQDAIQLPRCLVRDTCGSTDFALFRMHLVILPLKS
jgi:hypothetical protein